MELKLSSSLKFTASRQSSNRTFMELKYSNGEARITIDSVLIVPLWN